MCPECRGRGGGQRINDFFDHQPSTTAGQPSTNSPNNQPRAGNPPNNQPRSGNPPNNRPRAENPPNNQPRSGNPPNNQPRAGNPPHNQPRAGNSQNSVGDLPNNQPGIRIRSLSNHQRIPVIVHQDTPERIRRWSAEHYHYETG